MSTRSQDAVEFLHASYVLDDGRALISDLRLTIPSGQIFMLLGRSGSGKTTTLKLVNRLLRPTDGEVRVQGTSTLQWDPIKLRRSIGYAIQDVGLFPHYTVEQNVALIPRLQGWERERVSKRVEEVLALVDLPARDFAIRYPDQLSGGQRQRVGLARALAADPPILLMDEPFGALDPLSRVQLQKEFKALQRRLQKTVVFVTHDVGEALLLGDRIALMREGKLHGVFTSKEFVSSEDHEIKTYVETFRAAQQVLES